MKLECKKDNLVRGVSLVSKVSSTKGSLPILSHILLETVNGRLKLSATDLEMGVECIIGAHIDNEGRGVVPAKILGEYLPSVSSEKVSIVEDGGVVIFNAGIGETKVNGQPADEFPLIPVIKEAQSFSLPATELSHALSVVSFSASRDISRPEISGVFMSVSGDTVVFAATDGHRLAEYTIAVEGGGVDLNAIIPLKTAQEVSRIFAKEAGNVLVEVGDAQIRFSIQGEQSSGVDVVLVSKVVDGEYPDYKQIIPSDFKTVAEVSRKELVNAVKGVSVFSGVETNEVVFNVKGVEVEIQAESSDVGKSELSIEAKIVGDEELKSFNYRYVLEGVGVFNEDMLSLSFSENDGPMLITTGKEGAYLYMVMPLDID
jgi:DNA polymerase-3 subunit beta